MHDFKFKKINYDDITVNDGGYEHDVMLARTNRCIIEAMALLV